MPFQIETVHKQIPFTITSLMKCSFTRILCVFVEMVANKLHSETITRQPKVHFASVCLDSCLSGYLFYDKLNNQNWVGIHYKNTSQKPQTFVYIGIFLQVLHLTNSYIDEIWYFGLDIYVSPPIDSGFLNQIINLSTCWHKWSKSLNLITHRQNKMI